jgi:membrane-bound serine protease (ClpP class)
LLTIGVQAILIEISSPGGWAAGFIGVICLGLGLYGLGQLPANWLGLGLVTVAFVLFVLEVKAPVHGALALAGTATLLVGLLVLFNSPGTPEFARISISGAVTVSVISAAFFIFIVTMALRAQSAQPATGGEGLVGQKGPVRTTLTAVAEGESFSGMVLVAGELWRAQADEVIEKGEVVRVTAVDGFTLHVKRS